MKKLIAGINQESRASRSVTRMSVEVAEVWIRPASASVPGQPEVEAYMWADGTVSVRVRKDGKDILDWRSDR